MPSAVPQLTGSASEEPLPPPTPRTHICKDNVSTASQRLRNEWANAREVVRTVPLQGTGRLDPPATGRLADLIPSVLSKLFHADSHTHTLHLLGMP